MIIANTSLSGNLSKGSMSSSISEFSLLKAFSVSCHVSKAPSITQVDWIPPPCGWVKCDTDEAARGSPGYGAGGGIFRDYREAILGCFSSYFGICTALYAELQAAMIAIEIASPKHWFNLWLECDFSLV